MTDQRERLWQRKVLPATMLLVGFGFVDMVYTLVAVHLGWAHEANPLMAALINHSDYAFMSVKLVSLLAPITILEALRGVQPALIERAMRWGATSYIALYALGSASVHLLHM